MNQKRKNVRTSTPTKGKQTNSVSNNIDDNHSSNNFAFYSNMISDFQDLENFKVIPENADVESENEDKDLQNAVNMMINENESFQNAGKNELRTKTDFIKSKHSNDLYNLIQHENNSENIQYTLPTNS